MTGTSMVPRKREGSPPPRSPLVDEELADQLLGKAQAEGVELLGADGLLSQVTKAVLERALAEEMTGHLGYENHDPAGVADVARQAVVPGPSCQMVSLVRWTASASNPPEGPGASVAVPAGHASRKRARRRTRSSGRPTTQPDAFLCPGNGRARRAARGMHRGGAERADRQRPADLHPNNVDVLTTPADIRRPGPHGPGRRAICYPRA